MNVSVKSKRIFLSSPHMGGTEMQHVQNAFSENYIAPLGTNVDRFEGKLRDYLSVSGALTTASGTAGLHLGLRLLGVSSNDLVLCQSFTFVATVNPILYQWAHPVFIDSESDTWNMDPDQLERAIKACLAGTLHEYSGLDFFKNRPPQLPKAIVPVHLYGMPANMDRILDIADRYGIPVLEDAAEALGSGIRGRMCGTFGEMGVFSFNGNKIITTSAGGALVSADPSHIENGLFLSSQARDPEIHYQHSMLGYNYRFSNVLAGIGVGQMEVLDEFIEKRRQNFDRYRDGLEGLPGIRFPMEPEGFFSNRWLTTLTFNRERYPTLRIPDLVAYFSEHNIECRPLWKPIHMQPLYHQYPFFGDGFSEHLFDSGICLPSGSNLSTDDVDLVICLLRQYLSACMG
ncbi:DegT/DnrJ/EryC1/StrS family aminotransferase [Cyclobacterium xiamenense]|uniref:DegT/DnrJ/EryC1/StrS family aminotransferase n=1 Tax=Cyclobacterium xiamenense TaxID=1297121 RepID=UPI0012B7E60A|nr:DegT/DnrJ/EryC1/StrS family aminotransferase [Cyclobacterium xiamenense]